MTGQPRQYATFLAPAARGWGPLRQTASPDGQPSQAHKGATRTAYPTAERPVTAAVVVVSAVLLSDSRSGPWWPMALAARDAAEISESHA